MRNKYVLYGVIFLFVALFILVRAPFYAHFFVPEFDPDSFDYFNYSFLINHGQLHQIGQLPIDLPPGYPLFVSFCSLFTYKEIDLAIIQSAIYLIVSIAFIIELSFWGQIPCLLGTVGLLFYSLNSYTIGYEAALIAESLYVSTLVLLLLSAFRVLRNPSKTNVALLALSTILPSFVRPTGMAAYFVIIVFAFHLFKRTNINRTSYFIGSVILLMFFWASWNYSTSGVFLPGNYKRLANACHITIPSTSSGIIYENLYAKNGIVLEDAIDSSTFKSRMNSYLHQINQKVPNFYSSLLPTRIRRFYIINLPSLPQFDYMYDGEMLIPLAVKKYTYRDYWEMPQKDQVPEMMDQLKFENCKKNKDIVLYSVFNKLENTLIRNKISFLIIMLSLVLCVVLGFTSINSKNFIAFLIPVLLLFSSMVLGSSFNRFQYRYGQVIIFIVYLLPCLYAILLSEFITKQKFLKK